MSHFRSYTDLPLDRPEFPESLPNFCICSLPDIFNVFPFQVHEQLKQLKLGAMTEVKLTFIP